MVIDERSKEIEDGTDIAFVWRCGNVTTPISITQCMADEKSSAFLFGRTDDPSLNCD